MTTNLSSRDLQLIISALSAASAGWRHTATVHRDVPELAERLTEEANSMINLSLRLVDEASATGELPWK